MIHLLFGFHHGYSLKDTEDKGKYHSRIRSVVVQSDIGIENYEMLY